MWPCQPNAEFGGPVSKPNQPDGDVVKVHVTPRGGLYVHERELLRSRGARESMAKMDRILQRERLGTQTAPPDSERPRRCAAVVW